MRPLLPNDVRAKIRSQLDVAVDRARQSFGANRALEEAESGVVVHELQAGVKGAASGFDWEMRPVTVAPRLDEGGEGEIGADIVIELLVRAANGHRIAQKVVVIQAKKNWRGTRNDLLEQAKRIIKLPGSGVVADYSAGGYFAWPAEEVVAAGGDRRRVGEGRGLADMLGEFVDCRVGSRNLHIDEQGNDLVRDWDGESTRIRAKEALVLDVLRPLVSVKHDR